MASAPIPVVAFRLKHILFTTDFSSASESALTYAQALAERFGSTIHLLHVLEPAPYLGLPMDFTAPMDAQGHQAEQQMGQLLKSHPPRDIPHNSLLRRGPLWHVVADAIRHFQIDLVVTATHGRRGFQKLVLGSAAEEIFRRASCPVITIGPHIEAPAAALPHDRSILYATDFSPSAQHALLYALELARRETCRLILLHVLPQGDLAPGEVEELTDSTRRQLRALVSPAVQLTQSIETRAVAGTPADCILSAAAEEKAGLIVMGARRPALGGVTSHLPWATAHRVVCEAHCPVLTVRA